MHPSPSPSLLCASPASHPGVDPHTRLSRQRIPSPLSRQFGSTCAACFPLPAALIRCLWELPELLAAVALHCCPLLLPALLEILRLHASFAVLHTCYHCMPARPPQPPPQSDCLCCCSSHMCDIGPSPASTLPTYAIILDRRPFLVPALRPRRPHKHRESQPLKAPQP